MVLHSSHSRSPTARLLKDLRRKAGVRQNDLAERLGAPQSFVSKYETGERRLDVEEVQAICKALGLSFVDFALALTKRQERSDEGSSGLSS